MLGKLNETQIEGVLNYTVEFIVEMKFAEM